MSHTVHWPQHITRFLLRVGRWVRKSSRVSKNATTTSNEASAVRRVTIGAPEDMAFFRVFDAAFPQSYTPPRCEKLRRTMTEVSSSSLYEQFMDAIRLHQLQSPLKDHEFMVFKSTNHLVDFYHLLNMVTPTSENLLIVWLHCNTFDQLMSAMALTRGIQKRFEEDVCVDLLALIEFMVQAVRLKNAISATEVWRAAHEETVDVATMEGPMRLTFPGTLFNSVTSTLQNDSNGQSSLQKATNRPRSPRFSALHIGAGLCQSSDSIPSLTVSRAPHIIMSSRPELEMFSINKGELHNTTHRFCGVFRGWWGCWIKRDDPERLPKILKTVCV